MPGQTTLEKAAGLIGFLALDIIKGRLRGGLVCIVNELWDQCFRCLARPCAPSSWAAPSPRHKRWITKKVLKRCLPFCHRRRYCTPISIDRLAAATTGAPPASARHLVVIGPIVEPVDSRLCCAMLAGVTRAPAGAGPSCAPPSCGGKRSSITGSIWDCSGELLLACARIVGDPAALGGPKRAHDLN